MKHNRIKALLPILFVILTACTTQQEGTTPINNYLALPATPPFTAIIAYAGIEQEEQEEGNEQEIPTNAHLQLLFTAAYQPSDLTDRDDNEHPVAHLQIQLPNIKADLPSQGNYTLTTTTAQTINQNTATASIIYYPNGLNTAPDAINNNITYTITSGQLHIALLGLSYHITAQMFTLQNQNITLEFQGDILPINQLNP